MRPDSAEEMKRFEAGNEQPMNIASNNAFQVTAHKASPNLNADVGTGIYMATARTMDPPPLRNEGHGRRGNDIGNEARNSR